MNRLIGKTFLVVMLASISLGGCTSKTGPTLAGGKPLDEWLRALSDPDARLREKAVEKLGNAGPIDAAVIPALCGALRDENAGVRCQAILALAKSGSDAKAAIEPLQAMGRQDRDPRVRSYAAKALESLEK
jgi:HEAT repeat protein